MEKTLSPDERIRRAEEIYYRKKIQASDKKSARVNVSDTKNSVMLKKMILQIVICIVIYTIFYLIQNTNYIFSEDVIKKVKEILSYDININVLYEQGKEYINGLIYKNQEDNKTDNQTEEGNNEQIQENSETNQLNNESKETNQEISQELNKETNQVSGEANGIGGENVEISEEETESITQAEQDAKDILASVSLTIPLKGTITSRFGIRNSDNPIVSKYHTGIDIAVNEGTVFIAAMAGTVKTVSSEGEYRKSHRNYFWRCYDLICTLQNSIC